METLFEELGVKKILLPAAEETTSLWMNKFGFNEIPKVEVRFLKIDTLKSHPSVNNVLTSTPRVKMP